MVDICIKHELEVKPNKEFTEAIHVIYDTSCTGDKVLLKYNWGDTEYSIKKYLKIREMGNL
jgi:hypothetical protein